MKYKYLIWAFFLCLSSQAFAQRKAKKAVEKNDTAQLVRSYIDSLRVLRARLDSLEARQTSADARFYRLFAPATFYHSAAQRQLQIGREGANSVESEVDHALMSLYLHRPDLIVNSEERLRRVGTLRRDIEEPIKEHVELAKKVAPIPEEPELVPDDVILIEKPNFWTFKGDNSLQLMQNFISGNWHKGGESNYSMLANSVLEANYNNKQKVKWDNKLEMKLGFQTSRDDTLLKVKANNDLLRFTSKLGLQAHKNWYYTLQLQAYTQFTQGLKTNKEYVYSDFMSPFNLNIGLGMDYKVEWLNKRLTGSINLSFLSFNFLYVDRKNLNKANGIKGDHHSMEDFGSQVTVDLTWQIVEQVRWKTRLNAYTSYHRALVDWENTISLSVSKYISATLFLYPRLDDSSPKNYDDKLGYWQFKEYSSLGFTYTF